MKHTIIAAGKPALNYAKLGTEEYLKRLKRYGSYTLRHIKDGSSEVVSKNHLEASEGTIRIALDERGKQLTTEQLFQKYQHWQIHAPHLKHCTYLIGASDGHTEDLRQQANLVLALSPLTMQHELALVVLLEQLYRVATMQRNEPYHR